MLTETRASALRWRTDQTNLATQALQVGVNVVRPSGTAFCCREQCGTSAQCAAVLDDDDGTVCSGLLGGGRFKPGRWSFQGGCSLRAAQAYCAGER